MTALELNTLREAASNASERYQGAMAFYSKMTDWLPVAAAKEANKTLAGFKAESVAARKAYDQAYEAARQSPAPYTAVVLACAA